jgi:hypothetical protein
MNAPITRYHLKLLDAAEAIRFDPDKVEEAFMARQLVQATLPHKNPGNVPLWPSSTEAATRPNTECRDLSEFPFSYLTLAIRDANHPRGGWDTLKSRKKVPVTGERGKSPSAGNQPW